MFCTLNFALKGTSLVSCLSLVPTSDCVCVSTRIMLTHLLDFVVNSILQFRMAYMRVLIFDVVICLYNMPGIFFSSIAFFRFLCSMDWNGIWWELFPGLENYLNGKTFAPEGLLSCFCFNNSSFKKENSSSKFSFVFLRIHIL